MKECSDKCPIYKGLMKRCYYRDYQDIWVGDIKQKPICLYTAVKEFHEGDKKGGE